MGISFTEISSGTQATVQARIKEAILKSSDWAHLQLSTGTQNTTLSSGASAGAVSISTAATIPSGSLVVIGNGAANPECRITTGVSGSGPYTVTFADALVASYSSGAAVGVGFYAKATTTRGAQMVIDLNDAAINTQRVVVAFYRTHDGTTAGTKTTRYLYYKVNSGASTENVYVQVSVSKEHLFVKTEGPRGGETNADNATNGSMAHSIAVSDIVPYFGGDTIPAVAVMGARTDNFNDYSALIAVSRNQTDTTSWVEAQLLTLSVPNWGGLQEPAVQQQLLAKGDGNVYMWPYVVVEQVHGLRGRLSDFFFTGTTKPRSNADIGGLAIGSEVVYNSKTYKIVAATKPRADSSTTIAGQFGFYASDGTGTTFAAQIAVPKA